LLITVFSNTLSWLLPKPLLLHKHLRSRILPLPTRNSTLVSDTLFAVAASSPRRYLHLTPSILGAFVPVAQHQTPSQTPQQHQTNIVKMRSFQQVVVFLFALVAFAFAQDTESYDATVYITSTVYRVNTITMSGSSSGNVVNMTSTIPPSHAPTYPAVASFKPNGTSLVQPSGTGAKPTTAPFTGAASALNINAYVAVLAAGVGYLAL
jgi:hypothetical protein